jgi:uncharacterized membrane protein YqjE
MTTTDHDTQSGPGLAPLITGIINDAQELLRQQLTLFQTELKGDLNRTKNATIPIVVGMVVGLLAGFFVFLALAHFLVWLWPTMHLSAAYGIVALALVIAAGVLIWTGKAKFDAFNPLPDKTLEGLQENLQWKTKT